MRNETTTEFKKCITGWSGVALFCFIVYVGIIGFHYLLWQSNYSHAFAAVGSAALLALRIAIRTWLVVSPPVLIWWYFHQDARRRFDARHEFIENIAIAVALGAFISLVMVFLSRMEDLLVFIPSGWGSFDEDGDFVSTRGSVAGVSALLLSAFFAHLYVKATQLQSTADKLRHAEDALKSANQAKETAEREAAELLELLEEAIDD